MTCTFLIVYFHNPPHSVVSLSPIQICCQCGSLLRNACRKEETYITEEEGGTTVDYSLHSLPVFLCPSHLSLQHWTYVFIPAPHYLFISFVTPLSSSPKASSPRCEDSLLSSLPDSWKPHSEWRAHSMWLPPLLILVLTLLLCYTTRHTTARAHRLSRLLTTSLVQH